MEDFDVVVIGTGSAGQTAAHDLADAGFNVAVAEKSRTPGGTCALTGCQAKKWFYELTEAVARCRALQGLGITVPPVVNWPQVLRAKNAFTDKIPAGTIAGFKGNGITYLEGEARFADDRTIVIDDAAYRPRYIVIAVGALPMELPIKGGEHLATSSDFLDCSFLPQRTVFIGGGFISFEFAHFAARLGALPEQVHIIEAAERPLGPFDGDMVAQLVEATRAEGIRLHTGAAVSEITAGQSNLDVILESGSRIETDLVVHGAGRVADIAELNLQVAGIEADSRGIKVDTHMNTTNPRVFAVGDCAATTQLARVADREAHVAAATIIAREQDTTAPDMDYRAVPAVLFTYPQLGMVGKTEDQLKEEGVKYWKSGDTHLSMPTYRRIGMQHAAYKILIDSDGLILGAHFLGDNVSGLVNTFKQAIIDKMSVEALHRDNIMAPYPSRESDLIYMLKPLLD